MKRIWICACAICLLAATLLSAVGCGAKVDEAGLIADVKALIPKTEVINRLFHVEGIPLKKGGEEVGGYGEADMDAIRALGYENLEEILADMEGVWSEGYRQRFSESSLFTVVNLGSSQESKYCYDQYNIKTDKYEGIRVNLDGLPTPTDPTEYLLDTLAIKDIETKNRVVMTVRVRVTDRDDDTKTQTRSISFTVVRENNKSPWLLDTALAVSYSNKIPADSAK